MTPTERAKRSDALYYETVSVTRRVLCDMIANREADLEDAKAESEHMRLKALAVTGELQEESERLKADNAKLREQMERLVTLLRVDCDIDASWDGLRRFWSIGLTEGGCLMRDRACKAEAENAKLRELLSGLEHCCQGFDCDCCPLYDPSGTNHHRCESLEHELGIEVD